MGSTNSFQNRKSAGQKLADKLLGLGLEAPLVFAVPPGGVPVARPVAEKLEAPLDIAPPPEMETPEASEFTSLTADHLQTEHDLTLEVDGKTVIVVDDVIANGAYAAAAVRIFKAHGAKRIIVAAPVIAGGALERLRGAGAEVCAVQTVEAVGSIGDFFLEDDLITEQEVQTIRAGARQSWKTTAPHIGKEKGDGEIRLELNDGSLCGTLFAPANARGLVMLIKGGDLTEETRRSDLQNLAQVEKALQGSPEQVLATLVLNLSAFAEHPEDFLEEGKSERSEALDEIHVVHLLSQQVRKATDWLSQQEGVGHLPVGYFAFGLGAAAALEAAASMPDRVRAVALVRARLDLAQDFLPMVLASTLMIAGEKDSATLEMNRAAALTMETETSMVEISGADADLGSDEATEELIAASQHWLIRFLAPAKHEMSTVAGEPGLPL